MGAVDAADSAFRWPRLACSSAACQNSSKRGGGPYPAALVVDSVLFLHVDLMLPGLGRVADSRLVVMSMSAWPTKTPGGELTVVARWLLL